ncbi:hypothetical protein AAFF_G00342290 [Aldrovandia affinis]|uniref:Uncharacterized protein n=1 Tax=Aldrovandia affinis TaxID=143900 RepID=A0AAD7R6I8_9TELE|nr:hypothetical protein AAFF_G00342290 [Aldrovandia affinis]
MGFVLPQDGVPLAQEVDMLPLAARSRRGISETARAGAGQMMQRVLDILGQLLSGVSGVIGAGVGHTQGLSGQLLARVSEVMWAGMAIVVELLLDVYHVPAGVLDLPQLLMSSEISQVAEPWEP